MVITFADHEAETPVGSPFAPLTPSLEIPVAAPVVRVKGVKAVFIHSVGSEGATPSVFAFTTVIVPVA
jgi:hypothetical protein